MGYVTELMLKAEIWFFWIFKLEKCRCTCKARGKKAIKVAEEEICINNRYDSITEYLKTVGRRLVIKNANLFTWWVLPVIGSHKTMLWVPLVLILVNFVLAAFPFSDVQAFPADSTCNQKMTLPISKAIIATISARVSVAHHKRKSWAG